MATPRPIRPAAPEPPALHARAMDNLRYIRETMERASAFTAVSGWGEAGIGVTALAAAALAARQPSPDAWLAVWIGAAVVSVVVAGGAMAWKVRRARIPLLPRPGRKFALAFTPPILVGAVLTLALYTRGLTDLMPGMWLLLYGTAVMAGGAFSVLSVIVMGASFIVLGVIALVFPPGYGDLFMALGFGVLHIGFGVFIARRHGG